jgi:hypothetical protein
MVNRLGVAGTIARASAAQVGVSAPGATGEAPQSFILPRSERVPNNPRLPVLFYKTAIKVAGGDPAALFEAAFARNGWPPQWRNGVYDFITIIRRRMRFWDLPQAARASCLEVQAGAR